MAYLDWKFPLPRTHTGALLGNGKMGLMVWGESSLNITVGRAGFWDHRGANDFSMRTTYDEVAECLQAGHYERLKELFSPPQLSEDQPPYPTQMGLGELRFTFGDGVTPRQMRLNTETAHLDITVGDGQQEWTLVLGQDMGDECAWLQIPDGLPLPEFELIPSWHWIGDQRSRYGTKAPILEHHQTCVAMEQSLPDDPAAALVCQLNDNLFTIASALGESALATAKQRIDHFDLFLAENRRDLWWENYYERSAKAPFPDPRIQEIWDYGIYKQAGLTTPGGVAATLQGPWLESYQLPPWSCDYHFNINLQMVYWPCLATGHADHFQPLWDLIKSWLPQLQQAASAFFQNEHALMLPHAVDDRCRAVGTFWTGCIDSACTAWMAQMAWQYYLFTGDEKFLKELAFPLLSGAFETYWSMVEEASDGSLHFPVSVSPEFKGSRDDAWGADASFQLAACHFLAQTLPAAAEILGTSLDNRWHTVQEKLPAYSSAIYPRTRDYPEYTAERIELWRGMDLIESHRHHSHLGAIYPFCTIDPNDPAHTDVVKNSIYHWIRTGPGAWSGWCVPWASIIHARVGNGDGAVSWLNFWKDHFTNMGRGTLHDADFYGATTLYQVGSGKSLNKTNEIMQIEAGQGALHALCELLVQDRLDGVHVFPSSVESWQNCSFDGVCIRGGHKLTATIENGHVQSLILKVGSPGALTLWPGMGDAYLIDGKPHEGLSCNLVLEAGQQLRFERS